MGELIGAGVCLVLCGVGILACLWGAGIAVAALIGTFRR